jgi:glycosyltransferase involved in cell wall biosynthesis
MMESNGQFSERTGKRVALAHDFLVSYGGAERVLQELVKMYPGAPVYTLLADPEITEKHFPGVEIRTSFLQKWPRFLRRHYPWLLPLYPVAVETLDLREFALVVSSTGAWMKGLVTRLDTKHIAYVHSPLRYVWDTHAEYVRERGFFGVRILLRFLAAYLRLWDREAADRPDALIVNSEFTRRRIRKYYRREASVVYPPAALLAERFPECPPDPCREKPFLIVSRLTSGKKLDVAIEAFRKLGFPLRIVGAGNGERTLRKRAGDTVIFSGALSDSKLAEAYREARAVIVPSEEDFGMAVVEALSFGVPVIAYDSGGAREIVTGAEHGELFEAQTPEVLAAAVNRFLARERDFDPVVLRRQGERFSVEAFRQGVRAVLERESGI